MNRFSKLLCALLIALTPQIINAQDGVIREIQQQAEKKIDEDTSHHSGWRQGGLISIGIGQGASSNWAAGAERSSFSLSASANLFANFREGRFMWRNTLDLGYALVNTSSLGNRKTDDKIDFFSKLGTELNDHFSIGGVANLRTQFTRGYDYNYLGKGLQRVNSSFMAPAYAILAPGVDWHPTPFFSIFFSPIGARFVITSRNTRSYYFGDGVIPDSLLNPGQSPYEVPLSVLYGVDPERRVRTEVGGFASINLFKEVFKNVTYKSRLDLYSNYLSSTRFNMIGPNQVEVVKTSPSPEKVDVFWSNLLVMKVNQFLNVSYSFDLIYDDDVRQFGPSGTSPATQMRSQLTVGVSVKL